MQSRSVTRLSGISTISHGLSQQNFSGVNAQTQRHLSTTGVNPSFRTLNRRVSAKIFSRTAATTAVSESRRTFSDDFSTLSEKLREQLRQYESGAWTEQDRKEFLASQNPPKASAKSKNYVNESNQQQGKEKRKSKSHKQSRNQSTTSGSIYTDDYVERPEHLKIKLTSSAEFVQQLNASIHARRLEEEGTATPTGPIPSIPGFSLDEKYTKQIDEALAGWDEDEHVETLIRETNLLADEDGTPRLIEAEIVDSDTEAASAEEVYRSRSSSGLLRDSHMEAQINVLSSLTSMMMSENVNSDPNRVIWAGLGEDGTKLLPPLPNPQETISSLDWRTFLNLRKPHLWFPAARTMNRTIIVHMGPTNSGKTYRAMNRLMEARSGIYCGPLRLLAWENYEKMTAKGVKCALVTGQEAVEVPGATHCSSTVEMVDMTKIFDVAVLDEIQMLNSDDRGSSWTQALLGVLAREVHVCGDKTSLEFIRAVTELTGEKLVVNQYERLSPVTVQNGFVGSFSHLRRGDCVVVFNRKDVFLLRKRIEATTGKRCAVIYGTLPPDVRKKQAELFNDPDSGVDILIATDAIGMGLNLQIGRVIFKSLHKFDGGEFRMLHDTEILQIGGRAGRYNSEFSLGFVSVMFNKVDLEYVREVFTRSLPVMEKATLMPTMEHLILFLKRFPLIPLSQYLGNLRERAKLDGMYKLQNLESMIAVCLMIEDFGLDPNALVKLLFAPITPEKYQTQAVLFKWYAQKMLHGNPVPIPPATYLARPDVPVDESSFALLEETFANLDLYCWLANRFGKDLFSEYERAREDKKKVSDLIFEGLLSFTEQQFQAMKAARANAARNAEKAQQEQEAGEAASNSTILLDETTQLPEESPSITEAVVFHESFGEQARASAFWENNARANPVDVEDIPGIHRVDQVKAYEVDGVKRVEPSSVSSPYAQTADMLASMTVMLAATNMIHKAPTHSHNMDAKNVTLNGEDVEAEMRKAIQLLAIYQRALSGTNLAQLMELKTKYAEEIATTLEKNAESEIFASSSSMTMTGDVNNNDLLRCLDSSLTSSLVGEIFPATETLKTDEKQQQSCKEMD